MSWDAAFTVAGLVLDLAGAVYIAWGLFVTPEESINRTAIRLTSNPQESLWTPLAKDLIRQSNRAQTGMVLLGAGFALQIVGALLE
jgi:hypothetical protein